MVQFWKLAHFLSISVRVKNTALFFSKSLSERYPEVVFKTGSLRPPGGTHVGQFRADPRLTFPHQLLTKARGEFILDEGWGASMGQFWKRPLYPSISVEEEYRAHIFQIEKWYWNAQLKARV